LTVVENDIFLDSFEHRVFLVGYVGDRLAACPTIVILSTKPACRP
jgi:hypothetical protein